MNPIRLLLTTVAIVLTVTSIVWPSRGEARAEAQTPTVSALTVAVIVHPSVTATAVETESLRDILLGERQRWPSRQRIVVLRPGEGSTWSVVLSRVLRMNEQANLSAVATARYRGVLLDPPRVIESPSALRQAVAQTPGALGLVPASEVDSSVRVLTVDRRSLDDPAYPLRAR